VGIRVRDVVGAIVTVVFVEADKVVVVGGGEEVEESGLVVLTGTVDGLLPGLTVVLVVTRVGVVLKDGEGDVKGASGWIFVSK